MSVSFSQMAFPFLDPEVPSSVLPHVATGCEYPEIDPGRAEDNIKGGNCPPRDIGELISWYMSAGGKWAIKAARSSDAIGFTQLDGEWVFTFPPDDPKFAQGH